jgi:hypothetical protein
MRSSKRLLAAVGINCRPVALDGVVTLSVAPVDAVRARQEVASYAQQNQRRSRWGASRREAFSQDWRSAGGAQAGLIADGEWWRTLTALGLHADF